jgi:hypothetical protein
MLGNGIFSVKHSSINIANEYVSEDTVRVQQLSLMSSGAAYRTILAPDDVFLLLLASSTISAIPKSQNCGSPLSLRGQLPFRRIEIWSLPPE